MEDLNETGKTENEIYNILKTVIDPELDVNIIDLGLIYKIEYTGEKGIEIEMTLSSKGCPMGDVIMNNIESSLKEKFPDKKLNILLVWEPAWTAERVTDDGRSALGLAR